MLIHGDHIVTDRTFAARLNAAGLERVDDILSAVHDAVVAWSRSSETVYIPGTDGTPGFYLKKYLYQSWRKRIRGFFRGTFLGVNRARAERRALLALQSAGSPTVRPVAAGERRILRFLDACFLITEEVPNAVNLTTFMQERKRNDRTIAPQYRRDMSRALASDVQAIHEAGLSHGQLYFRNILIRTGIDGRPEFFFLDAQPLDQLRRVRTGRAWLYRELAQLAASAAPFATRSDYCRFLRAYLRSKKLKAAGKQTYRSVAQLVGSAAAHEQQRVRMNRLFDQWRARFTREKAAAKEMR